MNLFVRLAIVVATFLLITNMTFAFECDEEVFFNLTSTSADRSTTSGTIAVCLNDDGYGGMLPIGEDPGPVMPLMLFGGSPFGASFDLVPGWSTWIIMQPDDVPVPVGGFFWTQADGIYINSEGYSGEFKWIMKGSKVPCPI